MYIIPLGWGVWAALWYFVAWELWREAAARARKRGG